MRGLATPPIRSSLASLTDRSLVAEHHWGAWLVLLVALVPGLGSYYQNGFSPRTLGTTEGDTYMGVNYHVYHVAGERARAGEAFYDVPPEPAGEAMVFLYPPITAVAFAPFSLLKWTTGYLLLTTITLGATLLGTALLVQYVEGLGVRLGWIDVALIWSLFALSIHVAATIFFGNINVILGVAFVVGFWALATDRESLAGTAFALAALFKLFPALVGVWLLRDRRWRALGTAITVGVGGLIAGVLAFGPSTTVTYVTEVVMGRTESDAFVGGYPADERFYVTVQRPLSQLIWAIWPGAPYALLPVAAVGVSGATLAYFYRSIETARERLLAIFVTVVVTIVILPGYRLYVPLLFLPLVALLYTWTEGPGRRLFLAGGLLASVVARPTNVITVAESTGPLEPVLTSVATFATIPLYALALMVLAGAWHRRQQSVSDDPPRASP